MNLWEPKIKSRNYVKVHSLSHQEELCPQIEQLSPHLGILNNADFFFFSLPKNKQVKEIMREFLESKEKGIFMV